MKENTKRDKRKKKIYGEGGHEEMRRDKSG